MRSFKGKYIMSAKAISHFRGNNTILFFNRLKLKHSKIIREGREHGCCQKT